MRNTTSGYLNAYTDGTARPGTADVQFSSVNSSVAANDTAVVVPSAAGNVDLYNSATTAATVSVVVDGYYYAQAPGMGGFVPIAGGARKLFDTRFGQGVPQAKLAVGGSLTVPLSGLPSNATAVAINLTAVNEAGATGILAYSADGPPAKDVMLTTGTVPVSGFDEVAIGTSQSLTFQTNQSATDLAGDLQGYFVSGNSGSQYVPITSVRLADSSKGTGGAKSVGTSSTSTVQVAGASTVPASAISVIAVLTAITPAASGILSAGPSTNNEGVINFMQGTSQSNTVSLALSSAGSATFGVTWIASDPNINTDKLNYTVDVLGYYLPPLPQLTKTVVNRPTDLTPAATSTVVKGQTVTYLVTVGNPSGRPMSVTGLTDSLPAGLTLPSDLPVSIGSLADCLHGGGGCSVTTGQSGSGQSLTFGAFTVPANGTMSIVYSVLADVGSATCQSMTNGVSATDAAGASTAAVPVTVCATALGVEPWFSFSDTPVASGETAKVNVANGNLVVQAQDSTVTPARGRLSYVVRRSYNSQLSDLASALAVGSPGTGWQFDLGQADDLASDGITTEGLSVPTATSLTSPLAVTLVDRDGTRHIFSYRDTAVTGLPSPSQLLSVLPSNPTTLLSSLITPTDAALLPASMGGTGGFSDVCIDSTYTAPAGVHLGLWRYIGLSGGGATCGTPANATSLKVIGYEAVRPDRLRYEWDATGKLLDTLDGSGTDLRYTYGLNGALSSVYEARSCPGGTPGTAACRGITFTYSTGSNGGSEIDLTDVAGRVTRYQSVTVGTQKFLDAVLNPTIAGIATGTVGYTYQGVPTSAASGAPTGSCAGAAFGQLCSVTDERGNTSAFTYSPAPYGLPAVASVTDRRGTSTAFAYTFATAGSAPNGSAQATTPSGAAPAAQHVTTWSKIDTIGRVGQIDRGDGTGAVVVTTTQRWESDGNTCTFTSGAASLAPQAGTTVARNDNELCESDVQAKNTAAPTHVSLFGYTPQGLPLIAGTVISGSTYAWTTGAYNTQYFDASADSGGNYDHPVADAVAGGGQVTAGNHAAQLANSTLLYAVADQIQSLTPDGNASPAAGYAAYTTTDTPADNPNAAPNAAQAATTACGSRNSGVLCSQSSPYRLTPSVGFAATSSTYDEFGQKLTSVDGDSNTTSYAYYPAGSTDLSAATDTEGLLQKVTDAEGHYVLFRYDRAGNIARTFSRNATTATGFNPTSSGEYSQTAYGADPTNASSYPWRSVVSSSDPLGNTTTSSYDAAGDLLTSTDPIGTKAGSSSGHTTTSTYDPNGDTLTTATPLGNTTTNLYDPFGNTTASQDPDGTWTVNRYDPANQLLETDTDRGAPTASNPTPPSCTTAGSYSPIPSGDIVCSTLKAYDGVGDAFATTDAAGFTTTSTFNGLGKPLTKTVPRSSSQTLTTTTGYDADGNPTLVCSPRQNTEGDGTCTPSSEFAAVTGYDQQNRAVSTQALRQAPANPAPMVNGPATQTLTTSKAYDPAGNQTGATDAAGTTTTYGYNDLDRKTSQNAPRSSTVTETTTYGYDPSGNQTSTTRPAATGTGPVTAVSYDADNRVLDTVAGASDPDATKAGMASADGGSNVRTRKAYDPDGRVVATWTPDAFRTSLTAPDNGYEQVSVYDADGRLTTTYQPRYDTADAEPTAGADASQCQTGANTGVADYQNVPGLVVCKVGYGYDAAGQKTLVVLPTSTGSDNRKYTYTYSPDHLQTAVTEPDPAQQAGATSSLITADAYTYDADGRQLTDTNALGYQTVTAYSADGLKLSVTTPPSGSLTHVTSTGYDANAEPTTVTVTGSAGPAESSTTQYNSDGTKLTIADGAGDVTSYGYDPDGNTASVWSPSANSHATGATGAPDANFAAGRFTSGKDNSGTTATQYTFTLDNLAASELQPVDAAGSSFRLTAYGYDPDGRKTSSAVSLQDANNNQTGSTGSQTWTYYPDDRTSAYAGRAGENTTYTYEPAGGATVTALTRADMTASTSSQTFYLDGSTRTAGTDGATSSYAYDAIGSVSTASQYYAAGAGHTTSNETFTYSDAELPTTVGAANYGLGTVTETYDSLSRPTNTSYSASTTTIARTWQADNTLTNQTLNGPGGILTGWDYTYNSADQQTAAGYAKAAAAPALTACPTSGSALAPAGVSCYGYDAAGRLTGFTDDIGARTITDDHDSNRLSYGDPTRLPAAPVTTQTYNADDSAATATTNNGSTTLTSSSCYLPFGGLQYDEIGTAACTASVPTSNCTAYTYDGYDHEAAITNTGQTSCGTAYTSTFTRDALTRIRTRADSGAGVPTSGTTTDQYDGTTTQIVAENNASNLTRYAAAADPGLLGVAKGSSSQPLAADANGNVAAAATGSGQLSCALRYDPYGTATHLGTGLALGQQCTNNGGSTASDLMYQGTQRDAGSGDYHFGGRTYDPSKDAFTTPDAADAATGGRPQSIGTDPLTRDTYNYVNGDPLNLADPDGHHVDCGLHGAAEIACEEPVSAGEAKVLISAQKTATVQIRARNVAAATTLNRLGQTLLKQSVRTGDTCAQSQGNLIIFEAQTVEGNVYANPDLRSQAGTHFSGLVDQNCGIQTGSGNKFASLASTAVILAAFALEPETLLAGAASGEAETTVIDAESAQAYLDTLPPGISGNNRQVADEVELQKAFSILSENAAVNQGNPPLNFDAMTTLPDGTTVNLRNTSSDRSGNTPTIDVRFRDLNTGDYTTLKIHLPVPE